MKHPIPNIALDDRLGFLGTSGSGKTYNAGTAVEILLNTMKARVVIIDPLGVWWGLRLLADGKTPSRFNVVIFGGPRGDMPLTEHAGALIGEAAATMAESCILDLSELASKASDRRFMLTFLEAIYAKANGEPFHLVVDEADLFAPQKPVRSGDEMLLHHMEQIVRRGRVKGFIPWLISQRPAVLNKNVLSQVDGLIAFKLTSTQDRDALDSWIEGQADRAQGKAIKDSLPTLQIGQGIVWLPSRGILETAPFPQKVTFDSSRTPKRGEKQKRTAALKPLDITALRDRLSTVETEAKANDPRALRAEIAKLNAELSKKAHARSAPDPKAIEAAEQRAYTRGKLEGYGEALTQARDQFAAVTVSIGKAEAVFKDVRASAAAIEGWAKRAKPSATKVTPAPAASRPVLRDAPQTPSRAKPATPSGDGSIAASPGERAVLIAAAQYEGCDRDQLSVLTGYKKSSRDTYISRAREKGWLEVRGAQIFPTEEGIAILGDFVPLPTGRELQEYWSAKLPSGEWRVLSVAIDAYPDAVPRSDIDSATGFKKSSRDTYITRLRARRLLTVDAPGEIRASDTLF